MDRPTLTITIPEDGLYRIERGEITRLYQDTGHVITVEVDGRPMTVPNATWTVIQWDSEDLP